MKKTVSVFLTVAMSLSVLLTACDSKTNSLDEGVSSVADTAITENNSVDEPNTVNVSAKITIDGTKFMVDGKELWINGVNTPWDKWNDFGGGFNEEFWDKHFADLKSIGVNATRIWVNCNGMTAVQLNKNGEVESVSEKHWQDVDKLFELAEKHKIYIMPTLLSFDHFKDGNTGCDLWRMLAADEALTRTYIDSYIIPFVQRYEDEPYLWCVDLMNEPDWVVEEEKCGKLGWKVMGPFFARCAAAVHENSDVLVTVGIGMIKYNSDKYDGNFMSDEYLSSIAGENAYLDLYSTHYYWWQQQWMGFPFETTPEKFGLTDGKPCVIGEMSANSDETGREIDELYNSAYENGWNGVMVWTSNGVDGCGGFEDCKQGAAPVLELAPEKVFPLGK